jgi:ankyrin repeat protein
MLDLPVEIQEAIGKHLQFDDYTHWRCSSVRIALGTKQLVSTDTFLKAIQEAQLYSHLEDRVSVAPSIFLLQPDIWTCRSYQLIWLVQYRCYDTAAKVLRSRCFDFDTMKIVFNICKQRAIQCATGSTTGIGNLAILVETLYQSHSVDKSLFEPILMIGAGYLDGLLDLLRTSECQEMAQQALLIATRTEHVHIIRALLQYPGIDPTLNDNFILLETIRANKADSLKELLKDPRMDPSHPRNLPLEMAYLHSFDCFRVLLRDARVDPTTQEQKLLLNATTCEQWRVVELLLLDPRTDPSVDENQVLKLLAAYGKLDLMQLLFKHPKANIGVDLEELLMIAVEFEQTEVLQFLLYGDEYHNAPALNDTVRVDEAKPLYLTINSRKTWIDPGFSHNCLLFHAVNNRWSFLVKRLLMSENVDPRANGHHAVTTSAANGDVDALKIMKCYFDIDFAYNNNSALYFACLNGRWESIEYLLGQKGVIVTQESFCAACECGDLVSIRFLVGHWSFQFHFLENGLELLIKEHEVEPVFYLLGRFWNHERVLSSSFEKLIEFNFTEMIQWLLEDGALSINDHYLTLGAQYANEETFNAMLNYCDEIPDYLFLSALDYGNADALKALSVYGAGKVDAGWILHSATHQRWNVVETLIHDYEIDIQPLMNSLLDVILANVHQDNLPILGHILSHCLWGYVDHSRVFERLQDVLEDYDDMGDEILDLLSMYRLASLQMELSQKIPCT